MRKAGLSHQKRYVDDHDWEHNVSDLALCVAERTCGELDRHLSRSARCWRRPLRILMRGDRYTHAMQWLWAVSDSRPQCWSLQRGCDIDMGVMVSVQRDEPPPPELQP